MISLEEGKLEYPITIIIPDRYHLLGSQGFLFQLIWLICGDPARGRHPPVIALIMASNARNLRRRQRRISNENLTPLTD